jgi:hypothetical protein
MSGTVQEIAATIKELVATEGQVLGSRLSALLKARFPDWSPKDFGVRSLREFVTDHVTGVILAGRSGMDVVYGLEQAPPPADDPQADVNFWRVWVSPKSPYSLAVDRADATLTAVSRGGSAEPGKVLLDPPGVDFHRQVAREFLSSLPADLQPKLQAVLDSASAQWWRTWNRALRTTEHLAPWSAFRRQKLEDHLSFRVRAAGLEQPVIDAILKKAREQQALTPPRARRNTREAFQQPNDGNLLRRIVFESVQRMSIAELRELRLPLGIILDALATSKSR